MKLPIDHEYNAAIHRETQTKVKAMGDEYSLEEVPENVQAALKAILRDTWPVIKAEAALMKMETACLAAWARGEIDGPDSIVALERRAKQADSLAKMMDKKDNPKGAKKQRERAAALRGRIALQAAKGETP